MIDKFNVLTNELLSNSSDTDFSLVTVASLKLCERIRELPWRALLPDQTQRKVLVPGNDSGNPTAGELTSSPTLNGASGMC